MAISSPVDPRAGAESEGDLLVVENLSVTVQDGTRTAVRDVSLRIGRGETVGLVGESGSGKTLTCRAVLGVLPQRCERAGGQLIFDGTRLDTLPARGWERIHGTAIAAVFQDPSSYLNPSLTVGRQLSEVLRVKLGMGRREAHQRAIEMLASVGLHDPMRVYGQYPSELSGGMLQRVLIAIAISADPELLIADEATTALDVTIQAEIIALLLALRRERGLSVIFVSHDLAVVAELCDRIVVFYAGEIVEDGPAQAILTRPRHPYTQALLRVASIGDYSRRALETIPGQPPEVGAQLAGCRFADRCPFVLDACRAQPVQLKPQAGGTAHHAARCLRAADLMLTLPSHPMEVI